jgi:hypothetical protein
MHEISLERPRASILRRPDHENDMDEPDEANIERLGENGQGD